MLAEEPKYFNQLSRELGVSQQAVLKHLALMTDNRMLAAFRRKSYLGAPERKYFRVDRSLILKVGISSDMVGVDLVPMQRDNTAAPRMDFLSTIASDIDDVDSLKKPEDIIAASQEVMLKIRRLEEDSEKATMQLMALKQRLAHRVHGAIQKCFKDPLERRILYRIMNYPSVANPVDLSEQLNVREKEIERALRNIEQRVPLAVT